MRLWIFCFVEKKWEKINNILLGFISLNLSSLSLNFCFSSFLLWWLGFCLRFWKSVKEEDDDQCFSSFFLFSIYSLAFLSFSLNYLVLKYLNFVLVTLSLFFFYFSPLSILLSIFIFCFFQKTTLTSIDRKNNQEIRNKREYVKNIYFLKFYFSKGTSTRKKQLKLQNQRENDRNASKHVVF